MRLLTFVFFLPLLIIIVSGCEKKYTYSSIDENLQLMTKDSKELSNCVLNYWDLQSQGDYEKTFGYELPYQQFIKPLEDYVKFYKGNRTLFHITLKKIVFVDNITAMVEVITSIDANTSYSGSEKWIKINGNWRHKARLTKLPGHSKKEV